MKKILLSNGKFALLDDSDYLRLSKYNWTNDRNRYAFRKWPGRDGYHIYMHWDVIGKPENKMVVDHINRNGFDNRRSNLRIVTHRENILNTDKRKSGVSNIPGLSVSWLKNRKTYQAQTYIEGEKKWIGYFKNPIDAERYYSEHYLTNIRL